MNQLLYIILGLAAGPLLKKIFGLFFANCFFKYDFG